MAKKPLREPNAPPGPQYDFFDLLQRLIRDHGNKPLAALASGGRASSEARVYCSPQALHRAVVGPKLPSMKLLLELVRVLGCSENDQEQVRQAYSAAYADQIERSRRSNRRLAAVHDPEPQLATQRFLEQFQSLLSQPEKLSQREVASRVGLSPATLSRWFSGRALPRQEVLEKLLRELGPVTEHDRSEFRRLWHEAHEERGKLYAPGSDQQRRRAFL
jgi:hypothetical protein